ncbi:MAG TPA: carbohydrate kinase [Atribacteraceae bacterium]|nr:carbohydrate kinase [Atribacteraceae bacterium]
MARSVDICTLGEMLIDLFPGKTGVPLAGVTAFHPKPGGAPANVAVASSRLGKNAAFIGKVGDDPFGRLLERTLSRAGVLTRGMRFDSQVRTTLAFIAKPDEYSADILFYRHPGADMMLDIADLDRALLGESRFFHFGSISLIHEPSRSATLEAARYAKESGAQISFDVNYRPDLWADPSLAPSLIATGYPLADILKINENELLFLTRTGNPAEGSRTLLDRGPKLIVVTRGKEGSYFRTKNSAASVPAFAVPTVDATGCGDAFLAALLVGLLEAPGWEKRLEREELFSILRFASAAGALTARKLGVIPALPDRKEVEEFIKTTRSEKL